MRRLTALILVALAACREQPLTPEEQRGRQLVLDHGCGTCHVIPRIEGADGLTGPPLSAMARQAYVAGVAPNTPEALVRFIMSPQEIDPRSAMPDLDIGREDAAAIVAFLYAAGGWQ